MEKAIKRLKEKRIENEKTIEGLKKQSQLAPTFVSLKWLILEHEHYNQSIDYVLKILS